MLIGYGAYDQVGTGAGLSFDHAYARINDTSISYNLAEGNGVGIHVIGSSVSLKNVSIVSNEGFGSFDDGYGAGLYANEASKVMLASSTVTANGLSAYEYFNAGYGLAVTQDVTLIITDSIVAGNRAGSDLAFAEVSGAVTTSNGHNIFGTSVSGAIAGDRENVDPELIFASIDPGTGGGRLALNGGPTPTVALRDALDNPALSGADPFEAGTTDQRGMQRPLPGTSNPDIGAFELDQRSVSTVASANNDVLNGSSAANRLAAREGNDLLQGNGGRDGLDGGSGSDTLRGGDGNDILRGGFGNDGLDGGPGTDRALYRLDTDRGLGLTIDLAAGTAVSGTERDRLVSIEQVGGSIRDDTIFANTANAFLNGAEGQDLVFGRGGKDRLLGGPDDDQINGEGGNDRLTGNAGADLLFGGSGADTFDFNGGETGVGVGQRDIVDDFARGSDKLDLAGIDARLDQGGDQKFALIGSRTFGGVDGQLRTTTVGTDTVVQGDVDGNRTADLEIQLAGRLALSSSDFFL